MYKIVGCAFVWGFALFGFKEWYQKTYKTEITPSAS
jgi:hypothetical protein